MKIKVSIDRCFHKPESPLKALAKMTIDNVFTIEGFRIMTDKNGQLNVFMPQQSYTDRNGKKVYKDIAHPITEEARNIICGTILKQYQAHMQREAAEKTAGNTAQQQAQTAQLQPKLGQNYNYQSWDSLVNNPPPEPEPELEMG